MVEYGYILDFDGYSHRGYTASCDPFDIFMVSVVVRTRLDTGTTEICGRITPGLQFLPPPTKPIDIRIYAYDPVKHLDRRLLIIGAEIDENWYYKARAIDKTRWE